MHFQADEQDLLIALSTYFDVVGNRNYTFLRIAMNKIRTEIPILTLKAHEDHRTFVRMMKYHKFFENLLSGTSIGTEIGGRQHISWPIKTSHCGSSMEEAMPEWTYSRYYYQVRRFFQRNEPQWNPHQSNDIGKFLVSMLRWTNSQKKHTLALHGSLWSEILKQQKSLVAGFRLKQKVFVFRKIKIKKRLDDYKFLMEISENVYCACIIFGETNISLASIAKAMLSRKCRYLDFSFNFITHSDLESLLAVSEGWSIEDISKEWARQEMRGREWRWENTSVRIDNFHSWLPLIFHRTDPFFRFFII